MRNLLSTILLGITIIPYSAVFSAENNTRLSEGVELTATSHDDVRLLGSAQYAERERAAERLFQSGTKAIPALLSGLQSSDIELRWRCAGILQQLALQSNDTITELITAQLRQQVSATGANPWATLAESIHSQKQKYQHEVACRELQALGGEVEIYEEDLPVLDLFDFEADLIDPFGDAMFLDDGFAMVDGLEADDPFGAGPVEAMEELEIVEEDATPPLPDIAGKVAAALLPGKVGQGVRKALGLPVPMDAAVPEEVKEEAIRAKFHAAMEELKDVPFPEDFDVPALEAAELLPAIAPPPAADIDPFGVEVDVDGFDGEWLVSEPSFPAGGLTLTSEWRGGDAGLESLKQLRKVSLLRIEGAKLTDAALEHISKLAELKHLHIQGASFSLSGLRKFHEAHPQVSIMAMGDAVMGVNSDFETSPCTLATVARNSGAATAGLQVGDQILKLNGHAIRDFSDLTITVYAHRPGDVILVDFERNGEAKQTKVTLGKRE